MTSTRALCLTPELTEELIAEAMARAERVACTPGDQRCLPLPYDVASARATCTPKGRCKIGWIVADAGDQVIDDPELCALVWPH